MNNRISLDIILLSEIGSSDLINRRWLRISRVRCYVAGVVDFLVMHLR